MKDKVLPKMDLMNPDGKLVFSVVGLDGLPKFDDALARFVDLAVEPKANGQGGACGAPSTTAAAGGGEQGRRGDRATFVVVAHGQPHGLTDVARIEPGVARANNVTSVARRPSRGNLAVGMS